MNIGILKEPDFENRVSLVPDTVKELISKKANVLLEKDAGETTFITDGQYIDAGAKVINRKEIFSKADVIVAINPLEPDDVNSMQKGQVLIAALIPYFNTELVKSLAERSITAFSLELVPRVSRAQSMDILSSMATVAGYKAVLDAAMHLPKFFPMFMSAAGTIKPAKVLILGAGVAGLQAVAISRKLGAVVEVFDVRSAVKDEVKSLGGKFIEVEGARDDKAAGGYAVEQSDEFKEKQAQLIHEHAIASDVIICTAQIPGKKAPLLIHKLTVEKMKPGSVIIDLAASSGGNCDVTVNNKTIIHSKVTIIGKSDYPSDLAYDASSMFSKNVLNFLKLMIDGNGALLLDFEDEIIRGTCITHNGEIVNERLKSVI